ncbi:hypothetical protein V491_01404 [Pseudogymnoascus sp. VKM F-3775]|nr:hypothetical protein V491_01404 [Pseudogymnoascus sp. VKM F-3775]
MPYTCGYSKLGISVWAKGDRKIAKSRLATSIEISSAKIGKADARLGVQSSHSGAASRRKPNGWGSGLIDGIPVLAIANISTAKLTEAGWNVFIDSLEPHSYDEENYEVKFDSPNIRLNVYNLFYKTVSSQTIAINGPERLFYDYYKSGTILTFSTCATMYKGGLQLDRDNNYRGPISKEGESYWIQLNYYGRVYSAYKDYNLNVEQGGWDNPCRDARRIQIGRVKREQESALARLRLLNAPNLALLPAAATDPHRLLGNFWSQVKDWWHHAVLLWNSLVNVDGRALYLPPYDGHLWTIPIEYHGSIIVFLALLCVAKMRPWLRLCALAGFSVYNLWATHWEIIIFLTGALFCDVHFARDSIPFPSFLAKIPAFARLIVAQAALFGIDLFATHLLCYPDELAAVTPSYRTIVSITPHSMSSAGLGQRFWLAVGATLLVAVIDISPFLQALFTTRIAQYLGHISFALYIVHGLVLYTLGMNMLYAAKPIWDGEAGRGKFLLAAVGCMLLMCFGGRSMRVV